MRRGGLAWQTWGKPLNLSVPQFPNMENWGKIGVNYDYSTASVCSYCGLNELTKPLTFYVLDYHWRLLLLLWIRNYADCWDRIMSKNSQVLLRWLLIAFVSSTPGSGTQKNKAPLPSLRGRRGPRVHWYPGESCLGMPEEGLPLLPFPHPLPAKGRGGRGVREATWVWGAQRHSLRASAPTLSSLGCRVGQRVETVPAQLICHAVQPRARKQGFPPRGAITLQGDTTGPSQLGH